MSMLIREALELCRATLWGLLVSQAKGDITLTDEVMHEIDNVEQWAESVLDETENDD